jgi:hypothetical protein
MSLVRRRSAWLLAWISAMLLLGAPALADPAPPGMVKLEPNGAGAPSKLLLDAEGPAAGLEVGQVPTGISLALQRGFIVTPSALAAVCSNQQAGANQCPAASRFASGTIAVNVSGLGSTTAQVSLYLAPPQQPGDPAGAVFSFAVPQYGYSGSSLGRFVNLTDPLYGTELLFTQLPVPPIPPTFQVTLQNIKLTSIAPGATMAPTTPAEKRKRRKHHCRVVRRHGRRIFVCAKHKSHRRARAAAGGAFLTNPPSCSTAWAVRLQIVYSSGTQERDAEAPCSA